MALMLRNHEIRGLMGMPGYIAAVEQGYRERIFGSEVNLTRESAAVT